MAAVVFARYIPTLADWMSASPKAKDYLPGPNFGWTIALLDLGAALPGTVAVCIGPSASAAPGAFGASSRLHASAAVTTPRASRLGAARALRTHRVVRDRGAAVAGMAIAMQLRDDPAMSLGQMIVVMTVLGGALVLPAAKLYAPALRPTGPARMSSRTAGSTGRPGTMDGFSGARIGARASAGSATPPSLEQPLRRPDEDPASDEYEVPASGRAG